MKPTHTLERFQEFLDDRNLHKVRRMYADLVNEVTRLEDALATIQSTRKAALQEIRHAPKPEDFPVYTMTSGGRLWKWNCGWQEFDKLGNHIGQPIGWTAFRKFKLAKKTGDRVKDAWIRLSRPEGPWRRYVDTPLNHRQYGNGKVLLTDGLHALFEYTSEEGTPHRVEVMLSSLTEIAVKVPTNRAKINGVKKSREPKELKLSDFSLDLL